MHRRVGEDSQLLQILVNSDKYSLTQRIRTPNLSITYQIQLQKFIKYKQFNIKSSYLIVNLTTKLGADEQ